MRSGYLARVPASRLSEPSAYEYWAGGGNYTADVDQAAPLVEGGTSPSVAFDALHQRWLLAYATPLAREISVRTGLGVSGPWSAPIVLGACDLPEIDPESFCADIVLHPSLAEPGQLALSHSIASFARPSAATSDDFWTRFVRVPWPEAFP